MKNFVTNTLHITSLLGLLVLGAWCMTPSTAFADGIDVDVVGGPGSNAEVDLVEINREIREYIIDFVEKEIGGPGTDDPEAFTVQYEYIRDTFVEEQIEYYAEGGSDGGAMWIENLEAYQEDIRRTTYTAVLDELEGSEMCDTFSDQIILELRQTYIAERDRSIAQQNTCPLDEAVGDAEAFFDGRFSDEGVDGAQALFEIVRDPGNNTPLGSYLRNQRLARSEAEDAVENALIRADWGQGYKPEYDEGQDVIICTTPPEGESNGVRDFCRVATPESLVREGHQRSTFLLEEILIQAITESHMTERSDRYIHILSERVRLLQDGVPSDNANGDSAYDPDIDFEDVPLDNIQEPDPGGVDGDTNVDPDPGGIDDGGTDDGGTDDGGTDDGGTDDGGTDDGGTDDGGTDDGGGDNDNDGIPNDQDTDVDGDGIPNGDDDDVDGDGIPNGQDTDVDGDGVTNGNDDDIDGDGIPNDQDPDENGDGIPDNDTNGDGVVDWLDETYDPNTDTGDVRDITSYDYVFEIDAYLNSSTVSSTNPIRLALERTLAKQAIFLLTIDAVDYSEELHNTATTNYPSCYILSFPNALRNDRYFAITELPYTINASKRLFQLLVAYETALLEGDAILDGETVTAGEVLYITFPEVLDRFATIPRTEAAIQTVIDNYEDSVLFSILTFGQQYDAAVSACSAN